MFRVGVRVLAAVVAFGVVSAASPSFPVTSQERTLRVGYLSEPSSLNPLVVTSNETKDIVWLLFLKLLDEQPNYLDFTPRLAESWEFSTDSLSITFRIRDGVRWTDGTQVTAEDVRFTWELQTDTLVAWRSRSLKKHIKDVEVVDPLTVVYHFRQRYPYQLMDANDGVILPKHVLGNVPREKLRDHPFGRSPIGNGPYRLARWEPEQYIELAKNPDYYEKGVPEVERVVFRFVPDMVTLMTQLKKGEIDLLEAIPNDRVPELAGKHPEVQIYTYPSRDYWYVAWNLRKDLFADAEVRRALTMAIDRGEIIQTLWGGRAEECRGPIHPSLWAFDDGLEPLPFDPERSRRVLESKGWVDEDDDGILEKDGRAFVFELITNQSSQQRVDVATMVEANLRKVGVKASIRTLEFRAVVDKLLSSEFDACVFGWGTATKPDISGQWHSSSVPPAGYNISVYTNPAVDELMEKATMELDRARARELWSQVQRTIYNDQPFTFLVTPYEVNALHKRFCNVEPNAISFFYNLRYWRVGSDCE